MLAYEELLGNAVKDIVGSTTNLRLFSGSDLNEAVTLRSTLYSEYGPHYDKYNISYEEDKGTMISLIFLGGELVASAEIGSVSKVVTNELTNFGEVVGSDELEIRRLVIKRRVRNKRNILIASLMSVGAQKYLEGTASTYIGFAKNVNHAIFPFDTRIISRSFTPYDSDAPPYLLFRGSIAEDFKKVQLKSVSLKRINNVA